MFEQLAVIVYGVLTLITAIVLASMQHSVLGMALAFAACGVTYLFQFVQMLDEEIGSVLTANLLVGLCALVFLLTIASAVVSTTGY